MHITQAERKIILPITLGSLIEWYETYLYAYWTPIILNNFFDFALPLEEFINFILVVLVGLFARPFGGILFGYIGDRWGRKKAFLLSIILISIPSFLTALLPSFESWNFFLILYLSILKFAQGVPAGGELPGAMCFLAESAPQHKKRYYCSYTFVGPQIGQILSMIQCFLLSNYFSHDFLIKYGWRISFLIGGLIGVLGFFLRRKIHESQAFQHLKKNDAVLNNPVRHIFKLYKKKLLLGFFVSVFEVIGFYMIAFFLIENFKTFFNYELNLFLIIIFFVAITISLPFLGHFGDKCKNRTMLKISAIGVIIVSLPFYFSIYYSSIFWFYILLSFFILFLCIQFAILPSVLIGLYPTSIRFTCLGLSFNICDSFIGGLIPLLGIALIKLTHNSASFIFINILAAVFFLIILRFIDIPEPK